MALTKTEFPFQLVIHLDSGGFKKMEANTKIEYYDGDRLIASEPGPTLSFEELRDNFPLSRFLDPAHAAALLAAQEVPALRKTISEKDAEIANLRAAIEDRERLLAAVGQNVQGLGAWVAGEFEKRK
jgi:hypothetical protein